MSGAVSSNVPSISNKTARRGKLILSCGPREMSEVVDVGIRCEPKGARDRIVGDPGQIAQLEAGLAPPPRQLRGTNEFRVFMRAPRQDARDVLRPDDGHRKCQRIA